MSEMFLIISEKEAFYPIKINYYDINLEIQTDHFVITVVIIIIQSHQWVKS